MALFGPKNFESLAIDNQFKYVVISCNEGDVINVVGIYDTIESIPEVLLTNPNNRVECGQYFPSAKYKMPTPIKRVSCDIESPEIQNKVPFFSENTLQKPRGPLRSTVRNEGNKEQIFFNSTDIDHPLKLSSGGQRDSFTSLSTDLSNNSNNNPIANFRNVGSVNFDENNMSSGDVFGAGL